MQSGTLNLKSLQTPTKISNPLVTFSKRNNTTFSHYHITQESAVEQKFRSWLLDDIGRLAQYQSIPEYDPTHAVPISYFPLTGNPVWNSIKSALFDQTQQTLARNSKDLANINHCYTIYQTLPKYIIGRINRIKPSQILDRGGMLLASTFKSIIEEKGVRLEQEPHLFLHTDRAFANPRVIIFEGAHFEHIFDFSEYKAVSARKVIEKNFSNVIDINVAKSIILADKHLINMLNKPLVQAGHINTEIEYLSKAKDESQKELTYQIKNNKVVFPTDDKGKKRAVQDFLKVATYHITATLDQKHIIEGNPLRIIK